MYTNKIYYNYKIIYTSLYLHIYKLIRNTLYVEACLQFYEYTVLCFFMKVITLTGLKRCMILSTLWLPAIDCTFLLLFCEDEHHYHIVQIVCMANYVLYNPHDYHHVNNLPMFHYWLWNIYTKLSLATF